MKYVLDSIIAIKWVLTESDSDRHGDFDSNFRTRFTN